MPRRLPAVPLPEAQESLTSWINRIGIAYQLHRPDLLGALGLTSRGEMTVETANLDLSAPSKQAISTATGVPVKMIEALLLSRFKTTALPNLPPAPYTSHSVLMPWSIGSWVLRRHSNFCPKCLAEDDRWRLDWRLPWTFACLEHRVYLHAVCPRCKQVQTGVNWGRDSRICHRRRPESVTEDSPTSETPLSDKFVECRANLDRAETIPLRDYDAFKGQQRLLRWLHGTSDASVPETEFASLTAIVTDVLTGSMLYSAQPELQAPHADVTRGRDYGSYYEWWPPAQSELWPQWTDPLYMAGAAHVAHFLSATEDGPEQAVRWLKSHLGSPLRYPNRGRLVFGTSLVFGPYNHDTAHMREALHADLVSLPPQAPAYVNDLSPYQVKSVRPSRASSPYGHTPSAGGHSSADGAAP
ncbi:TniQ family protein [Streptomyces sp. 184]|uniref:TniQ family protein n=1 Tax=Streptomyces sp. 184 TaxID=1827526 RepID=UPI003892AB37